MPVAGELPAAGTDAAGSDRFGCVADTAAPLNCACADHKTPKTKKLYSYRDEQDTRDKANVMVLVV
jgi:hypothetical protein